MRFFTAATAIEGLIPAIVYSGSIMATGAAKTLTSFKSLGISHLDGFLGRATPLFWATAFVMVASLLFGGGTRSGFLSDVILQLIALPLLLFSLWRQSEEIAPPQMRVALYFCAALVALPLLQLLPLPSWLWTLLPHRQVSAEAFEASGQPAPWVPISVSPQATWLSALSLIPPLAIFVSTLLLSYRERRWLCLAILAVGVVSVFVGLIQVAQGQGSALRFFQITNPSEAVGFFANRNHFAALIYVLMLFAVAWTVQAVIAVGANQNRVLYDAASLLGAIAGFTILVIFLTGEAMARSRAGLGITIVGLFGALALGYFAQRDRGGSDAAPRSGLLMGFTPAKLLVAAVFVAAIFSFQYALFRIQERFDADPTQDWRHIFTPVTIEAANAYMLFGSGLGTFTSVYPLFEKPQDALANTYANAAHNDVAQVWLETGVFGVALVSIFIGWFILRSVKIWRNPPGRNAAPLDWTLARAATIVIVLILAHSFVDYPLRTEAMMAIMAFSCALLIEPAKEAPRSAPERVSQRSHERQRAAQAIAALGQETSLVPTSSTPPRKAESTPPRKAEKRRWGEDIKWPEEWSSSATNRLAQGDKPKGPPE